MISSSTDSQVNITTAWKSSQSSPHPSLDQQLCSCPCNTHYPVCVIKTTFHPEKNYNGHRCIALSIILSNDHYILGFLLFLKIWFAFFSHCLCMGKKLIFYLHMLVQYLYLLLISELFIISYLSGKSLSIHIKTLCLQKHLYF